MVFAAPVAAAAQSHNTVLRQAPIEVSITLSDPDTESAWFDLSAINDMDNMVVMYPNISIASGATNRRDSWHVQLEIDDANKRIRATRGAGSLGSDLTVRTLAIEFMPWVIEERFLAENAFAAGVTTVNYLKEYEDAFTNLKYLRLALFSLGQTTDQNTQSRGHTETNLYFPAQGGNFSQLRSERGFSTGTATHGFIGVLFSKGVLENDKVLFSTPFFTTGAGGTLYSWQANAYNTGFDFDPDKALFLYSNCRTNGGFQFDHSYVEYVDSSGDKARTIRYNTTYDVTQLATVQALAFRSKWAGGLADRGVDQIDASAATDDVTVSNITDLDKAIYSFLGMATDNPFSNIDRFPCTIQMTTTSNLRATRGVSATNFVKFGWNVIQLR